MSFGNGWTAGSNTGSQIPHQSSFNDELFEFQQQAQQSPSSNQQPHQHQHHHHHHQDMYTHQLQPQMYSQHQHFQDPIHQLSAQSHFVSTSSPSAASSSSSLIRPSLNTSSRSNESTLNSAFGHQYHPFPPKTGQDYLGTGMDGGPITQSGDLYSAEAMMMGMGVDFSKAMGESSSSSPNLGGLPTSTSGGGIPYGLVRSTSESSSSLHPESQFDLSSTTIHPATSESSFASSSSPSKGQAFTHQQLNAQLQQEHFYQHQQQHSMPYNVQSRQGKGASSSSQRLRKPKPAALDLHDASNLQVSSPNAWVGLDSSTPSATSRYSQEHQPTPSPTWQQQQQGHHAQSRPYPPIAQQTYSSSGLLSPVSLGDSIMSEFQSGLQQSGNMYNNDTNSAFVPQHSSSFDLMRPNSSASGISIASSRNSGQSEMQRSNSHGETQQQDLPDNVFFHQMHQTGGTNSQSTTWLTASPAGSDNSSQFQQHQQQSQGPPQRLISTPQRLQQMRNSIMLSDGKSSISQSNQTGQSAAPSSYNLPSANLVDFDYTDHRLSAALANNAQISSRPRSESSSSSLAKQMGKTTPTIMEEEESTARQQGQQQQLQHQQQSLHRQTSLQGQGLNNSPSIPQPLVMPQIRHSAADTMIKRRPNIRPNIYQQYAPFATSNFTDDPMKDFQDCTPFIDEVLGNYLASPSRLGLGERSVLIMTSKVAQKSYGAEKRFLCPPPMVLLVGSSWWSSCHDGSSRGSGDNNFEPTVLTPPRLSISMSGESNMQESALEWASNSGRLIDVGNPSSEMAISGRSIGRQLFINDSDEKRRHCEALVHISVPGISASDRKSLGTFASKPIKVISKPSKKRQSTRTSDLSVNHGSTISLFHRLRSQTVSTRYLCVSGAPTWFKGSDGEPFLNSDFNNHIPNQAEPSSCFVAKMSSWDPFIIYLVDPLIDASNPPPSSNTGKAPPVPGYPPPPINVLPIPANGQGQPIYYNQPVVLQCLNTSVVSPVMVIRKVDRGTTVIGGGQSSSHSATANKVDPSIETLGDPVSQLHKIAFEVLEDPHAPVPIAENREATTPGQSGHFLGCLNEDVGLRKPLGPRQWVAPSMSGPSTPTTPITPMTFPSQSSSLSSSSKLVPTSELSDSNKMLGDSLNAASMAAAAQAAAHTRFSMSQKRGGNMSPSASMVAGPSSSSSGSSQYGNSALSGHQIVGGSNSLNINIDSGGEEDGGKVKRPRRVSSSVVISPHKDRIGGLAAKNRRRGQSLSIVGMQNQLSAAQQHHLVSSQHHHQQQQAAMQSSFSLNSSSGDSRSSQLRRTDSFSNSVTNSETSSLGVPAGAMWTVDVHDSDIWTIVGTDIARHTFYLPNQLIGGVKAKMDSTDQGIAHLINVPAPATPITPLPVLHSFASPSSSSTGKGGGGNSSTARPAGNSKSTNQSNKSSDNDYVTLVGENLTNDLFIYFGDWRSTRVTVESSKTIYCEPPPAYEEFGLPRGRVPIILVRRDGVVFPTTLIYTCSG